MYITPIFIFLHWLLGCQAVPSTARKVSCRDVFFTFNVTSTIRDVPLAPDLSLPGAIEQYQTVLVQRFARAANTTRRNTYTLAGVYCPVSNSKDDSTQLQVLVHGSSYTKEYWRRGAWGNLSIANSWVDYAHRRNYSTLAIDRLCNGASSHPDPQLDCQLTTSTEVLHTLISALRTGKTSSLIPIPRTVTYVGHSAGSIIGSNLVQVYPQDVDSLILTGYPAGPIAGIGAAAYSVEHNVTAPTPPPSTQGPKPAYLADPVRFSGLDQGYLASTNATARTVFYAGDYDPGLPKLDFISRGSLPLGEASYTGALSFSAYRGRVIAVTGELDGAVLADRDIVRRTQGRFPSASRFEWIGVPDTGHDVNFHRAAPQAFRKVFETLEQ